MKLTSAWIREWLGRTIINDTKIVEALAQAGMEIEQVIYSKAIDENVVVCSVKKVVQHPGADRLHLVTVETDKGQFSVVCGAPNVRVGIKVPFAQIGSVLPGGEKILRAKLRGEVSHGMLCSARELGIGSDHEGILELDAQTEIGLPLSKLFPSDTLIDLKTPANRFDTQSVLGLARDVAAITGTKLSSLPVFDWRTVSVSEGITSDIAAERFEIVKLQTAAGAVSPHWLQARLRAAGMRPVNLLVDITNYVMLDVGQPLHAYDAAKIHLPIGVRRAKLGEQFTTLDGIELSLSPEDLVVTDAQGVIGLAGVMGGQRTGVSSETSSIWLEAATFDKVLVRKTAQRYGLRTEASARFERGLPVELPQVGLARAVALLQELANAKIEAFVCQGEAASRPRTLKLALSELTKIAGFDISHKVATGQLRSLLFDIVQSSKSEIKVHVPWWRPDVRRSVDLIEEIVRLLGYDKVPSRIPSWQPTQLVFDNRRARLKLLRDVMYGAGLFEVMTYSFVAADQITELDLDGADHLKLLNPLSSEQAYLRQSMLASHLAVAERNRTYAKEFAFYELSNVFIKPPHDGLPNEPFRLAVTVVKTDRSYRYLKGILDALSDAMHLNMVVSPDESSVFAPGRAGLIWCNDEKVGRIGQLHPNLAMTHKITAEIAFLEVNIQPILESATPRQYQTPQRFPVITRDISFWSPDTVYWEAVAAELTGHKVTFVDDYTGEGTPDGMRGLTLRLTVAHPTRTPTDAEADVAVDAVTRRLANRFKFRPRD